MTKDLQEYFSMIEEYSKHTYSKTTFSFKKKFDNPNYWLGNLLAILIVFTPIACCSGILTWENHQRNLKVSQFYQEHGQIVKVVDIYGDRTKDKFNKPVTRAVLETLDGTKLIYSYFDDSNIIPIKNELYMVKVRASSAYEDVNRFEVIGLTKYEKH